MSEERVDKILLKEFPQLSRSKVQSLISKGKILYKLENDWISVVKPGQKLSKEKKICWKILEDEELEYVSRGALKLKEALDQFKVDVSNLLCLDIGLSTGGFSDCLLQRGAKKILGVDVGREQLHPKLREHSQLVWFDKINAREVLSEDILSPFFAGEERETFQLIVVDVSFISLDKIIPHLKSYMSEDSSVIALVKPQFELSRADLNKKGVVKDSSLRAQVLQKISRVFSENGLKVINECLSPIEGENGNQEVLIMAQLS